MRIILVDVEPSDRDAGVAATLLRGDARAVLGQLGGALVGAGVGVGAWAAWTQQLAAKAGTAVRVCVCACVVCACVLAMCVRVCKFMRVRVAMQRRARVNWRHASWGMSRELKRAPI